MKTRRGFTLTELSVAIVFISILLLTIAVVTMNMVRNYHKGLTMKSINTVGLDLISEFRTAISESPVFDAESLCKSLGDIGTKNDHGQYSGGQNGADICMNDGAKEFLYQQFTASITITKNGVPAENKDLPTSGVFCTGKYSYVWNTGYVLAQNENDHTMTSNFYSGGVALGGGFRLRKYSDVGRSFCYNNFSYESGDSGPKNYPDTTHNRLNNTARSMMLAGDALSGELINVSDLAIYSLTVNRPVVNQNSGRALFSGSFVLGSITGDIEVKENYSSCKLEGTSNFDVEYCATNKFNFAIRAMGGNSGN